MRKDSADWNRRGRVACMMLCTGLVIGMLSGCGGEYGQTGVSEGVSGSAVSGSAVSGSAVSEAAVNGDVVSGDALHADGSDFGDYRFCNDSHLYYQNEKDGWSPMIEHDLSDGSEREIRIEGDEDVVDGIEAVCYVNNKWVYYVRRGKDYGLETASDFCRAPIEEKRLNVKKEELIFTEKHGIEKDVYCDGRYVLYTAGEDLDSDFMKYDIEKRKYIGKSVPDEEDSVDLIVAVNKKTAFISGYDGLLRQELDSEKMTKVTDEIIAEESGGVALTESDLFYIEEDYDDVSDKTSYDIWQYHLADDKKIKICSEEQYTELLMQKGYMEPSYECRAGHLLVSGDRLYLEVTIVWDTLNPEAFCYNKVVLSQKIGSSKGLRIEEKLTKCLENPKENQKIFEKIYDDEDEMGEDALYLSRGTCMYMAEEKCYMCLYDPKTNKNRIACFDLSSGELKFPTEKDPDWYVPYYNGAPPYWKALIYTSELMDLPNNKRVEWYW